MSGRHAIGERVVVQAEATVVRVSDSHGLCYEVQLDDNDFANPRLLWADPPEIRSARAQLTAEDAETLKWVRYMLVSWAPESGSHIVRTRAALALLTRLTARGRG